ncbi:UNVERIFIED_ORG: 5'-3' nuclease [Clostridium botulinum]
MRKLFNILRKYLVIAFILSTIMYIAATAYALINNIMPTVNITYIIKYICSIAKGTVLLVPMVAVIHGATLCCKSLVKDFKESDKKGKIVIIVICIMVFLRKLLIWTS